MVAAWRGLAGCATAEGQLSYVQPVGGEPATFGPNTTEYMCFAIDTGHGICGRFATTDDFRRLTWLSVSSPEGPAWCAF